jgi:hypothetical protein
MRPALAVYFYFLRVTPTVLLLRASGTRRTQAAAYLQPTLAASIPLAGCAANLDTAVYEFITNSWYSCSSKRNSIRMHS